MSATVISAVPNAFEASGALDRDGNIRIFEHALDGGVHALFVNGTTGEFPSLTREERQASVRDALSVGGTDRVIAHVGASSAYEAVALTRDALDAGATAIAAITPFYLSASASALWDYFGAVRQAAGPAALYLYLFPARTGIDVSVPEALQLVREFGFAGVKVSMPGLDFVTRLIEVLPAEVRVFSGNDGLLAQVVRAGGGGVVSGVSSALPAPFVSLAHAVDAGDAAGEAAVQPLVEEAVATLGPSIAAIKTALHRQGIIESPFVRMAIDTLADETIGRIDALIRCAAGCDTDVNSASSGGGEN